MKVEKRAWITRQVVRTNPDKAFLFGDNLDERGLGGQAREMRGEPNAFGIPTKRTPSMNPDAFFDDRDFNYYCWCIDRAINKVISSGLCIVVIPEDGLGTGRAKLDKKAPRVFEYLQDRLEKAETW